MLRDAKENAKEEIRDAKEEIRDPKEIEDDWWLEVLGTGRERTWNSGGELCFG